jgi:hypothetical protein
MSEQRLIRTSTTRQTAAPRAETLLFSHASPTIEVVEMPFVTPFPLSVVDVAVSAGGAPSGGALVVDLLLNGVSVLSSKPTVADGETTSDYVTPTTSRVFQGGALKIEFESVNGATGVVVYINYRKG